MTRLHLETECACCHRTFRRAVPRSLDVTHLCGPCNDEALNENAHSDGYHEETVVAEDGTFTQGDANCHVCCSVDPHAGFRPVRVAPAGAGSVKSEADGRLRGNAPTLPEAAERIKLTGFIRGGT